MNKISEVNIEGTLPMIVISESPDNIQHPEEFSDSKLKRI